MINPNLLSEASIQKLKQDFEKAKPYKHLAIDNFLSDDFAAELYANFPKPSDLTTHYKGLNEFKSEGSSFDKFHPSFRKLKEILNSEEWRKIISTITGIDGLYSVDDSMGSGVHQGVNGSYLDIHIDFNIHVDRNIHRRINLLIFLNKDWKDEYGGHCEMWNKDVSVREQAYLPGYNRCVIFETNEISYHGYGKVTVPEGKTRNSFFCYYYTDLRADAARYHDTVFKARPEEGTIKKIKTNFKETLKNEVKYWAKKVGVKI